VAGAGEIYGDSGGKVVADFPEVEDVRILAHRRFQEGVEGHPGLFVNLLLVGLGDPVFHRILDGNQASGLGVHVGEKAVDGRRLSRSRWSHDEDETVPPRG